MNIRKLTEDDAAALWNLRLYALETDANSFGESAEELRKTTVKEYDAAESFLGECSLIQGIEAT